MTIVPFLLVACFVLFFFLDAKKGILAAVIIRPVVVCFWDSNYAVAGFKATELLGVLLPTLVAMRILLSGEYSFSRAPLALLWMGYWFFQLFSTAMIFTSDYDASSAFNHFFRNFNGFIGLFIYQEFFRSRSEFRALLIAHLVAGLFPLGMSVYQNVFGATIRTQFATGGLVRKVGFYHDAYTVRIFSMQTLVAALLYWSYFLEKSRAIKLVLISLGTLVVLTVYKLYSKAGYLVLGSWGIIWPCSRRKFGQLVLISLLVAGFFALSPKSQEIDLVYSKEVNALAGEEATDRVFQGRVGIWKSKYRKWQEVPALNKIMGDGAANTGAHNDFLRVLFATGIAGLVLYLVLLVTVTIKVVLNCLRRNTQLNVVAVMLMTMWFIDAIGLVPGAYPEYQIFVWGFVGLALRGSTDVDCAKVA